LVHISPLKQNSSGREAVHIRSLNDGISVTSKNRLEVIDSDEKNVGPLGGRLQAEAGSEG
jgi:hypothetical protein